MTKWEFRILGPFMVLRGDELVADGGGKRRALLAALLLSANRTVSPDRLIECLWGADPPKTAANLVQGYVSDWRTMLDPDRARRSSGSRLVSTGAGYLMHVGQHECDLLRFTASAREGRQACLAGDLTRARRLLAEAVGERRGSPLADFAYTPLSSTATLLDEDWLGVVELAADVEIRLGFPDQALAYVEEVARENPLRETLTALRMRALYQAGRQIDALAAYEAVRSALAEEVGVDPGPRLRELHLDVLRQSPALAPPTSADTGSASLPHPLSSLVGRTQALKTAYDLVGSHRLVTLTGPGGSGKTRLAVEVARRLQAESNLNVTFVDLSPVREVDLLWPAVASALGRPLPAGGSPVSAVARLLPSRPALLVLDNLEQLSGAGTEVVRLLDLAPAARVLATSRAPLGVSGEQRMKVPPLPTPPRANDRDRSAVMGNPAVSLFVDRAKACDPAFDVSEEDIPVLAGVCRRLDGLPLTLELAAPWTTSLSLRGLLERLDQPLALLTGNDSSRPERHRTLRAALDWTYTALTGEQRTLLAQMSVFVSGARLDAIEAVADPDGDTLTLLADLIDKNLVTRVGPVDQPRYRLLETIREYAHEQLAATSEHAVVVERHAHYFRQLAELVARAARTPQGDRLATRLDDEQDEIRSTLSHLSTTGATDELLTVLVDCLPLWWDLGHVREGHDRLTSALLDCDGLPDESRAAANLSAVVLADAVGQPDAALALARRGHDLARRVGSLPLQAFGLCLEGNSLCWKDWSGSAADGIAVLESARRLGERIPPVPPRWGWFSRASVLATAALVLVDVLRYRDARRAGTILESTVSGHSWGVDRHTESFVLRAGGSLAADAGRWAEAEHLLGESLALAMSIPSRRSECRTLEELARSARAQGNTELAGAHAASATRLARESGHALNWARSAVLHADVALDEVDFQRAANLLDEADMTMREGYPQLVLRMVAPRRSRLARLSGNPELAGWHLDTAMILEHADGLTPDRVVYLVEAAHRAAHLGDTALAVRRSKAILYDADRVGIVLPVPEQHHLDTLSV